MKSKKTLIDSPNSTWPSDLELTVLRFKKLQSTTEKASSRLGFLNVAQFGLVDGVWPACELWAVQHHPRCQ